MNYQTIFDEDPDDGFALRGDVYMWNMMRAATRNNLLSSPDQKDNLQEELARLKEEIRDLKTAQTLPGYSRMYRGALPIPAGNYRGVYAWTITFEQDGFGNAPIIHFDQGVGLTLLGFNFINNTQQIEFYANPYGSSIDMTRYFYSTRPIASVGPLTKTHDIDEYTPPPTWQQVRSFSLSRMGTTPGYCLMNCRLGFGINSGT